MCPHPTQTQSMGGNSDNFCIFPKCLLGTLETTFHGHKTFRSVGESGSWSNMVPKLPLSAKMQGKNFFIKELYLGNLVTETPKVGLKLKIFART